MNLSTLREMTNEELCNELGSNDNLLIQELLTRLKETEYKEVLAENSVIEKTYLVTWTFTVDAEGHTDAAKQAEGIFIDYPSSRTFTVVDIADKSNLRVIDLSE